MKRWRLSVIVETEDSYTPKQVLGQLDMKVNDGDGLYMELGKRNIKLLETLKDED